MKHYNLFNCFPSLTYSCLHFLTVINNDAVNILFINFAESQLISSAYIPKVITCKECEHLKTAWHLLHNFFLERLYHLFFQQQHMTVSPSAPCRTVPIPGGLSWNHGMNPRCLGGPGLYHLLPVGPEASSLILLNLSFSKVNGMT